MSYSKEFLTKLAKEQVSGDFPPFNTGTVAEVEKYIKTIIGQIKDRYHLLIEPDFSYHGSGFASYVNVRVAKRDGRELVATGAGGSKAYATKGLLLYISNLSPYWYYGAAEWSETVIDGQTTGGSWDFLRPESISQVDDGQWYRELEPIKKLFERYRYSLLTQHELASQVDSDIPAVRTVLADKPYHVFDYFFHWMD